MLQSAHTPHAVAASKVHSSAPPAIAPRQHQAYPPSRSCVPRTQLPESAISLGWRMMCVAVRRIGWRRAAKSCIFWF